MTYDAERARTHTKQLLAVQRALPELSALALSNFVAINPRWNGAEWADALDVLDDSDSHLEVTEPMYDALGPASPNAVNTPALISLVTITLVWAWKRIPGPLTPEDDGATVARLIKAVEAYLAFGGTVRS